MDFALKLEGITKRFGSFTAVDDLSLEVPAGCIYGFLGQNGAGKTTTIRMVMSIIHQDEGSITVLGHRPFGSRPLYRRLGFCPQQDALYEHQTGRAFVRDIMRLAGFGRREADRRAVTAMERVGLTDAMDRKVSDYSKGMRQRTRLAQAVAHDPEIVVADEPLTGLDPIARRQTLELFRGLANEGKSVILSSHVLHEVESLTDTMVLIHRGRLLAQGSVRDVRRLINKHPSRVHVKARDPRRLASRLLDEPHVTSVSLGDGEGLLVETQDVGTFHRRFAAVAGEADAGVRSLVSDDASLEAVFDYLVG